MINVKAAEEAYNEGIFEHVICIRRNYNLADVLLTETSILPQLMEVMEIRNIEYEIKQSIK